ncbi:MAG: benzoate-CoA ligase family protein [Nocardioidaceae bacterium]|nr:benzoate-CoA ligase family protein [Nocardioidaceae bacterium]NUS53092.1 benzoate-CoA ligase family protein [Nocardioidaceae bacterium]
MTGFNAADYLVSRHVAEGRGDRTAVVASETLSYADLDERVGAVAAGLRGLGLRRDDRVLLVMSDEVPMLTGILGAFRAGFVAVPVSTMLTGKELGGIVADSGARAVIATPEFLEAVGQALAQAPDVEHLVVAGGGEVPVPDGVAVHGWADLTGGGGDPSYADTVDDSWALWLYTSGTTGLPKAAMHRHANIRHVCETYGAQVLGITPDDVTFSVAKLFFAYGIGNSMFFPFSVGAATVLEPRRPTPDVVRERLAEARPTLFFGVPTFYAALTASDLPDDAFASVRLCASAGEPLPAPLQNRFTGRFGVEILDGIGSTEALHIFLSNRPGDVHPGTTGLPVPGYDVQLRGDDGAPVPDGEPGALHVRGESIALGYWHRTDASRQVFQGEWLKTGDTYVRSGEGYYTCLGRNSDMLKAGGIWVSPAEVESRLLEHPAVREAAVVGVADADGLDKPVAVVVTGADVDEASLVAWCRDGLAHFKSPRRVVFVSELPKTATGKLQRFKVRDFVSAEPAAEPTTEPAVRPVVAT